MTERYSLREARQTLGLTVDQLVQTSGISDSSIRRIEDGCNDGFSVHAETASRLARALGCKVEEIDWPHGLSQLGRPPGTGTVPVASQRTASICHQCFTQLPASGSCDYCA